MTDDLPVPSHPASPDETQASLRAQLLVELLNAQAQVRDMVEAMRRDGVDAASVVTGEQQLLALCGLQRQLAEGRVSPGALQQAIAASLAASTSAAQQGHAQAATAREAEMAALQTASAEAHRTTAAFVQDFYEKRIFDPYLHFDTPEDERVYHEREAARRQQIERAQAENTPEAELRASSLALEQLKDAGAHGATASPDFQRQYDQVNTSRDALAGAMGQKRRSTSEVATAPAVMADGTADPKIFPDLKNTGIVLADQTQTGHGVTLDASIAAALGRA